MIFAEHINIEKIKENMWSLSIIFTTIDDSEIHLTVNFDIFIEMLLLQIRGETIKYASYIKKKMSENEKILISKIETLEQANTPNMELLTITKIEIEKLREKSMKGHLIRSHTQWLSQGEKPTKYFGSLEHHNYTEKTVKKVIEKDRTEVSDQNHILNELKSYYSNLFKSQDLQLDLFLFYFYLFGVLRSFQQCTGHIMTGSRKGRGNQYIQLVKVLYCRPTASNYQLFHLRLCREPNPGLRGGRQECYHSATVAPIFS